MKKINIVRSWLIGSFVLFGITSCTAGFEDANRPGHETSLEELGRDDYAVSSFITFPMDSIRLLSTGETVVPVPIWKVI